jgi:dihydroxyacetone kinase-like protein
MPALELITRWMERAGELMEENREQLTRLDAALGDADHGINMSRGFRKVRAVLSEGGHGDAAGLLKAVAMALMSSVGGAAGPLYGTFFLKAADAVPAGSAGEDDSPQKGPPPPPEGSPARGGGAPTPGELAALLQAGLEGVVQRGRARPGDKTMVDALHPAAAALERAAGEEKPLAVALAEAEEAARRGMEQTVPMTARKGRASYLGERSAGHQDPGATSSWLLVKALRQAAESAGEAGEKC